MSFLKKLLGGSVAAVEPIPHDGFLIFPEPMKDAGGFRLAARIEKTVGEDTKVHQLIRADTFSSQEEAAEAATNKARLLIDQMGDALFG